MTTKMQPLAPGLSELSTEQCLSLLATQPVGRLALSNPGGAPLVVPVNFVVDGDAIVFRTDPGLKLRLLDRGPVSFQVDFVDPYHRRGWSVLVTGVASLASYLDVAHLTLESWTGGLTRYWVRLQVVEISGRWLDPIDLDWGTDERAYL